MNGSTNAVVFEEELVQNGMSSTLKYFNFKGYGLRVHNRVPISQKPKVLFLEAHMHEVNEGDIKEKYKELARVFHGSKPAKQNTTKSAKKPILSFPTTSEEKKKQKPKTLLFGFS